jgi:hypothetical protein
MKSFNELIKNYSQPCRVTADFEDGVFSRIEKIKKMKKIGISGGAAFIVALVFSVFLFFPGSARRDARENRFATRTDKNMERVKVKEEVPVLEDVFFTLTDGEKNYAIEQVSVSEEEGI